MTPISLAVFIMMLVAAGLGFSTAWIYKSESIQKFLKSFNDQKQLISKLKDEQDSLVAHANSLQSNQLKSAQKSDKQNNRIQALKDIIAQLEHDKEFIFKEYEQFRNEVKEKLDKSQKLVEAVEEIKEKNQKWKLKADKWKIRFHETQEKLIETEASYLKVKKEKEQLLLKISSTDFSSENMLEWENNYKELKLQFLALTKEKKDLEKEIDFTKGGSKGESGAMNKLSEEIVLLKRENKLLSQQLNKKASPSKSTSDKESLLERIKSRSKQVDFGRIGKADSRSTDDLRKLKGLGVLIEQKFHAIGINTFAQIANLNAYDEKLLNFFLELPQGKIESEKWVPQARAIVGLEEDLDDEVLTRIKSNIDKINFDRIGEASPKQKDNLQAIIGIGPFIEKKLNAIGIFRLEQLARLNDSDIDEINGIIELAPGHINSDDWVGQAQRMK